MGTGVSHGMRLVDAALGDRAEGEREPAVDGVVEELGGADVERDERGDDAERATGLVERDGVRGGEFSWGRGEARQGRAPRRKMDAGKGRTCAEEGERDREEEEQNDEPEVPAKRCDPGSAA